MLVSGAWLGGEWRVERNGKRSKNAPANSREYERDEQGDLGGDLCAVGVAFAEEVADAGAFRELIW